MSRRGRVRGGKAYEWVDGGWVLRAEVAPGSLKAETEFFRGCEGGPQDVEKLKRLEARNRAERVRRLEEELARAKEGL